MQPERPLSDFGDRRLWGRDMRRDMEALAPEAAPRLTPRESRDLDAWAGADLARHEPRPTLEHNVLLGAARAARLAGDPRFQHLREPAAPAESWPAFLWGVAREAVALLLLLVVLGGTLFLLAGVTG